MALQFPEFLQTKTYTALRDRLALSHGGQLQAGVWDAGDFKVTQGTNMVLNVAAGFALVPANNAGNAGLYHIQNDAAMTVTIPAANATLPRVDQIVIDVSDSAHGGDAGDTPALTVVQGTPTSGATLANRNGAVASLPSNTLRIADVFVGAAVTSITTANIMDRRAWARGAYAPIAETGGNVAIGAVTTYALVAAAPRFTQRVECSGVRVRVTVNTRLDTVTAAGSGVFLAPWVDGALPTELGTNPVNRGVFAPTVGGGAMGVGAAYQWEFTPTAGTHLFQLAWKGATAGGGSLYASTTDPCQIIIEEIVRQIANNGTA